MPTADVAVTKDGGIGITDNVKCLLAEAVVADCEEALQELTDDLSGSKWRRRWAAFITLLRCIGHVLDKVDAKRDMHVRQFLAVEWPTLREDDIFKYFIEDERNGILKEYCTHTGQGVTVVFGPASQCSSYHILKVAIPATWDEKH